MLLQGCVSSAKKTADPSPSSASAQRAQPAPLKRGLGFGDELTISVWRHDDLNASVKVDQFGAFRYPLIGKVQASGKTSEEVGEEIAARLETYVVSPQVMVTLSAVKSQVAYVFGEVNNPGAMTIDHEISLWETVARCGGFTDKAGRSKVLVLRGEGENLLAYPANMELSGATRNKIALEGGLRSGDIVYVPRSNLSTIEDYLKHMDTLLNPILTLQRFVIFMPQVRDAVTQLFQGNQTVDATVTTSGSPQGGEVLTNQGGGVFVTN